MPGGSIWARERRSTPSAYRPKGSELAIANPQGPSTNPRCAPDGGDEGYRQQANGNPGRPIALLSARSQGDPAEPDCGQQREEGEQDGEGAFSETARHGQQADAESQQGADSRGSTTKGERDVAHGQRFETRSAVDWPMPIPIKAPTATSAG